jgi:hypothetical protein
MGLPMLCQSCGLRFEADRIIGVAAGTVTVHVQGTKVTCPRCNAMADQVTSGAYEVSSSGKWRLLGTVLREANASRSEWEALQSILLAARARGATAEQIADDVTGRAPAFSDLAQWMQGQGGIAVATWLAILIQIVLYIVGQQATAQTPSAPPIIVNVTVNNEAPSPAQIEDAVRRATEIASNSSPSPARR